MVWARQGSNLPIPWSVEESNLMPCRIMSSVLTRPVSGTDLSSHRYTAWASLRLAKAIHSTVCPLSFGYCSQFAFEPRPTLLAHQRNHGLLACRFLFIASPSLDVPQSSTRLDCGSSSCASGGIRTLKVLRPRGFEPRTYADSVTLALFAARPATRARLTIADLGVTDPAIPRRDTRHLLGVPLFGAPAPRQSVHLSLPGYLDLIDVDPGLFDGAEYDRCQLCQRSGIRLDRDLNP